jgi:hypothetical protein
MVAGSGRNTVEAGTGEAILDPPQVVDVTPTAAA